MVCDLETILAPLADPQNYTPVENSAMRHPDADRDSGDSELISAYFCIKNIQSKMATDSHDF